VGVPKPTSWPINGPALSFSAMLEEYYLQTKVDGKEFNFLTRKIPREWYQAQTKEIWPFGSDKFTTVERVDKKYPRYRKLIARWVLKNLWVLMSKSWVTRMTKTVLKPGGYLHIKRWFDTTNGYVLPYILTCDNPKLDVIDSLTKSCLENCAGNYSSWISTLKRGKKAIRKRWAENTTRWDPAGFKDVLNLSRYRHHLNEVINSNPSWDLEDQARCVLTWTQTRATGLADSQMTKASLEKLYATLSVPETRLPLINDLVIDQMVSRNSQHLRLENLTVSAGTSSCLQSTRLQGGKTGFLKKLASHRCLHTRYDWKTLKSTSVIPRSVNSARDLVDWSIQESQEKPLLIRMVRTHAVAEPSKARSITISHFGVSVLLGMFAHYAMPLFKQERGCTSGLKADRHLWNFATRTLHPLDVGWENLGPINLGPVEALSTDLEEATDFGEPEFARKVWRSVIFHGSLHGPDFPVALAYLAMRLHTGMRIMLRYDHRKDGFHLSLKRRGWLMGDMFTKVVLTAATHYAGVIALRHGPHDVVGDDLIAMARTEYRAELHAILDVLRDHLHMKVSTLDTYVSSRLAFYCEEGLIVPQKPADTTSVSLRRGNKKTGYVDYPRIRLLLDIQVETTNYSYKNIGRTSLLGKESKWAYGASSPFARDLFTRAQLLQHLLLKADKDTICPFIPQEIGGDGSFPMSPGFLSRVIEKKSKDLYEVRHRINELLHHRHGWRLVRSDHLTQVVHKHHIFIPVIQGLKGFFDESCIIVPKNNEQKALLGSLRTRELTGAHAAVLTLLKQVSWYSLFRGRDPPELDLSLSRAYSGTRTTNIPDPELGQFIRHWSNPGFKFQNDEPFWIRGAIIPRGGRLESVRLQSQPSLYKAWDFTGDIIDSSLYQDRCLEQVISGILAGNKLPSYILDRLPLFIESDNYIMATLDLATQGGRDIFLISGDRRLADRISMFLKSRVVLVQPIIYLMGLMDNLPTKDLAGKLRYPFSRSELNWREKPPDEMAPWGTPLGTITIPDQGAIWHADSTLFTDGLFRGDMDITMAIYDRGVCLFKEFSRRDFLCNGQFVLSVPGVPEGTSFW
jgi:hypothetical protein